MLWLLAGLWLLCLCMKKKTRRRGWLGGGSSTEEPEALVTPVSRASTHGRQSRASRRHSKTYQKSKARPGSRPGLLAKKRMTRRQKSPQSPREPSAEANTNRNFQTLAGLLPDEENGSSDIIASAGFKGGSLGAPCSLLPMPMPTTRATQASNVKAVPLRYGAPKTSGMASPAAEPTQRNSPLSK